MTDQPRQCDFCRSRDPRWQYGCGDFRLDDLVDTPGGWGSTGDWAACQPCDDLIQADDWVALSARMERQAAHLIEQDRARLDPMRAAHAGFRTYRTGTRKPFVLPPSPTTQASVYSRALDLQADVAHYLTDPAVHRRLAAITDERLVTIYYASVSQSEAAYVSPVVCQLLNQTYSSLPDVRLLPEDLLVPNGFVMPAEPLSVPMERTPDGRPYGAMRALSWLTVMPNAEDTFAPLGGAFLVGWLQMDPSHPSHLDPITIGIWPFSDLLSEALASVKTPGYRPAAELLFPWLGALNAFCHQQLLTGRRGPPERAVRRRLERAGREPSQVLVVELRRTQQHRAEPSGRHIAEDFSFSVSGHWRRQWHESIQDHRPRWINPYLKGNTDAPLRPRRRVFAIIH